MIQMSKYTFDKEWFSPKTLDMIRSKGLNPKIFLDQRILDFVDQIREHFGKPILMNQSKLGLTLRGFRTFEEQKALQSETALAATFSQHCYGRAADISVSGIPDIEVVPYCNLLKIPFVLPENGWTHIDVRNT